MAGHVGRDLRTAWLTSQLPWHLSSSDLRMCCHSTREALIPDCVMDVHLPADQWHPIVRALSWNSLSRADPQYTDFRRNVKPRPPSPATADS